MSLHILNKENNEIHLYFYDEIEEGLDLLVEKEINKYPNAKSLYVHINSPGGYVDTGWTIGNTIASLKIPTTALIKGYCGSIATYIALSCDTVKVAPQSRFMIHNASIDHGSGNKHNLLKQAQQLDSIDRDLRKKYKEKTNLSDDLITKWMDEEKVFDASETLQYGFADSPIQELKAVAKFDLNKIKMTEKEVKKADDILSQIKNLMGLGQKSQISNQADSPKNEKMLTLEDGTLLYVLSDDGEFVDKRVFIANDMGNPSETPAPNGQHRLKDGRMIVVSDGVITSVSEVPDNIEDKEKEDETEEMKKKIDELTNQIKANEEAIAKYEAKDQEITALKEQISVLNKKADNTDSLSDKMNKIEKAINSFAEMSSGTPFKVDKIQPKMVDKSSTVNKDVSEPEPLSGFANYIKSKNQK